MTVEAGQTLLHYRIVDKLGEGGMGVVWRAVDTTLDREVAIKVLPPGLAAEVDRLARFEREARLLASLNHPNIAGIHGIHDAEGTRFLAMELVEGQDLQERLAGGKLSREQTLKVALQIAQAFEAAHDSGVIHRDLKPANVKLTDDGTVKVLDFGLAKALASGPSGAGSAPSMSPTLTSAGTVAGMILGTAAYMSPEQAKGKDVDRRADIWSFGVVLFEMLTGRRLFEGEGISETLAAVIMKEVDFGALPADTPAGIRRLLERCLQRDPKSRLRDIGDARIRIEEALQAPEEAPAPVATAASPPGRLSFLPWAVAALALAALGWLWATGDRGETEIPTPVMRFTMTLAEDQPLDDAAVPMLAISPDGRRIAYVGRHNNEDVLFLRLAHQQEAVLLKGTEDADYPFFSPDGEWIGFNAGGKLKKVSVLGGPPLTLCDARRLRGATWGTDETIVFSPNRAGGIMRVPDAGGDPELLTLLELEGVDSRNKSTHRWPDYLPGNRAVIVTHSETNDKYAEAEIVAYTFEDESLKTLVENATFGRFVPPGFLVFARENTLFAARFDPERLEVVGPAVPVVEGVSGTANFGSKQMAVSDNGTLLYLAGGADVGLKNLVWIDREGNETPATSHERDYGATSISPAGTHVAVTIESESEDQGDIWVLEFARDTLTRLTFDEADDFAPAWSPDGEWIVFSSSRDGDVPNLYRKRADGTGEVERLTTSELSQIGARWSPDGRTLTFMQFTDSGPDIMLYRFGAEPAAEPFLATPFGEWFPQISPDGRWIAYATNASGAGEVYVRSLSGGGAQIKVSTDGGNYVQWGSDATELIYRTRSDKLASVSMTAERGTLRPALPVELFDYARPPLSYGFEVSRDGRRLLVSKNFTTDLSSRREPVVVINWIDELEARVPAAK